MRTLLIAIVAIAWAGIGGTQAQVYPSRPITMIVPLPAGSAFDVTARLVAERMRVLLGQPVIVENLTGSSGSIGTGPALAWRQSRSPGEYRFRQQRPRFGVEVL